MARVKYNVKEIDLLARLMRAEAESEGNLGMLMVGNVGVNRVVANCFEFKNVRSVERMVTMHPGGFEATLYSYFYLPARNSEKKLAKRVLNGETFHPATYSLWFYNDYKEGCKSKWWEGWNSGRYKSHCFYSPVKSSKCY